MTDVMLPDAYWLSVLPLRLQGLMLHHSSPAIDSDALFKVHSAPKRPSSTAATSFERFYRPIPHGGGGRRPRPAPFRPRPKASELQAGRKQWIAQKWQPAGSCLNLPLLAEVGSFSPSEARYQGSQQTHLARNPSALPLQSQQCQA